LEIFLRDGWRHETRILANDVERETKHHNLFFCKSVKPSANSKLEKYGKVDEWKEV